MTSRAGTGLLVTLLVFYLVFIWSRAVLPKEGPPAFFMEKDPGIWVELGEGFPSPGIHQFYDGVSPSTVIEMTGVAMAPVFNGNLSENRPLVSGERLEIVRYWGKVIEIKRDFMPAGRRIALGVPLHVDRMAMEDWLVLPGVGVVTAQRIEKNRQQNGAFCSLEGLSRVKGVGRGRIRAWSEFF